MRALGFPVLRVRHHGILGRARGRRRGPRPGAARASRRSPPPSARPATATRSSTASRSARAASTRHCDTGRNLPAMIERAPFGATGHESSRAIFGAAALGSVSKRDADRTLELLLEHGINHIDVAAGYGDAELRIAHLAAPPRGRVLRRHQDRRAHLPRRARGDPPLARPPRRRPGRLDPAAQPRRRHRVGDRARRRRRARGGDRGARGGARAVHRRDRPRPVGARDAPAQPRALRLRLRARARTTTCRCRTRATPRRSRRSPPSARSATSRCRRSRASRRAAGTAAPRPPATWYEPLREQADIDLAAHWVLGRPEAFLLTTGDVEILPRLLDAAERFERRPSDERDGRARRAGATLAPLFV